MSRRRERLAKTAGGPGPPTGSRTPIYYPDPSAGREQTPRLGQVRSRHVSAGAGTRAAAKLPREDSPTYRIQYGRRKCALPQQSPRRLFQAVLLIAHYQGAQYSRWRHPRHARQSATPVRHDNSATEYHNAYAVDPTVYAATYTASTGTSPLGQVKTPLGQRVYRAMKRIRQEIHKALLMSFLWYTIHPRYLCTRLPCAIKGRRPLEKNSSRNRGLGGRG